jgi:hypothetical protein
MHGFANCIDSDGLIEEGQFKKNQLNGPAKRTLPDGTVEDGIFEEDELNGQGKRTMSDGTIQ